VSTIEGESALTERAQRQRGNGRLQGSEGVRAVRSRSDGEGSEGGPNGSEWVQGGPSESERVRAVRSKSDRGKSDRGKIDGCGRRRSSPRR
jgi:hypothetical protein